MHCPESPIQEAELLPRGVCVCGGGGGRGVQTLTEHCSVTTESIFIIRRFFACLFVGFFFLLLFACLVFFLDNLQSFIQSPVGAYGLVQRCRRSAPSVLKGLKRFGDLLAERPPREGQVGHRGAGRGPPSPPPCHPLPAVHGRVTSGT